MVDSSLVDTVIGSFSLAWNMVEDALLIIPEEEWNKGDIQYLTPSRLILHIIETEDFFTMETPVSFPLGYRFNCDWQEASSDNIPVQAQMLDYFNETRNQTRSWITMLGSTGLLMKETDYPWTGSTRLGRALYILSNSRQHLGEINAELRRRGLPRVKWRTF